MVLENFILEKGTKKKNDWSTVKHQVTEFLRRRKSKNELCEMDQNRDAMPTIVGNVEMN